MRGCRNAIPRTRVRHKSNRVDAKDFTDKGLHKGQLFTWNVYNDVATQGTVLTETSTIPQTNFTIAQGTGTVTELANAVNDNLMYRDAA